MPGVVTPLEEDLLAAVDRDELARHLARLDEGGGEVVPPAGRDPHAAYIAACLREWGVPFVLHRFEILVEAAPLAHLTLARRTTPVAAAVYPRSDLTPPDGITAELRATSLDTAAGDDVRGFIALLDGPPSPAGVTALAALGAVGQIYIGPGDPSSPGVAAGRAGSTPGGAETRVVGPVVSIDRAAGEGFRALCAAGPAAVRLRVTPAPRLRRLVLPVATLKGVGEPHDFILVGATGERNSSSSPAGVAVLLELCRVLASQAGRLRWGVRLAWWPRAAALEAAGWYADHAWEELGARAVAYVDLGDSGDGRATDVAAEEVARGGEVRVAPALRSFVELTLRDGRDSPIRTHPSFVPSRSAAPFARLGLPALALAGGARDEPLSPDADGQSSRLREEVASHVPPLARLCTYPILPLDHVATARAIEARLGDLLLPAGDTTDLAPLRARATAFRVAAERFGLATLHLAQGSSTNYEEGLTEVNRTLRRLNRELAPLLGHGAGALDPSLSHDAPALLAGLAAALAPVNPAGDRMTDEDDEAAAAYRRRTAAIRERNRLLDVLNRATTTIDASLAILRPLGFG